MNFVKKDESFNTSADKKLRQDIIALNKSVSVIIPFRDDVKGMSASISSVVNQLPRKLLEIIIVDYKKAASDTYIGMGDGEKSEYQKRRNLLKRHQRVDKTTVVSLYSEDTDGEEWNTRLYGATQAHGDYLLFLNEGDTLTGDFLAGALTEAEQAQADLVIGNIAVKWPTDKVQAYQDEDYIFGDDHRFFEDYIENAPDFWGWYFLGNKLIRRDLWERSSGAIGKALEAVDKQNFYGEDLLFASVLWKEAQNAVYVKGRYAVFNWGKEDAFFKKAMHVPMDVVKDIKFSLDFLYRYIEEEDDAFFPISDTFVRRFWWRSEWTLKGEKRKEVETELKRLFYLEDLEYSGDGVCIDFEYETKELFGGEEYVSDKRIKIYTAIHKPAYVPEDNKYIVPIQVGAALSEERFPDMLHDDEGDNISEKNKMYRELTAQYWAYKNDEGADYYGFWHYRRYFAFSEDVEDDVIPCESLNESVLAKYGVDERHIAEYCDDFNIILPEAREIIIEGQKLSAYEAISRNFEKKDLDLFIKIITSKYPLYYDALMEMLDSKTALGAHLFIMRKDLFREYSALLFDVLGEFEAAVDFSIKRQKNLKILSEFAKILLSTFAYSLEQDKRYSLFNAKVVEAESANPLARVVKPIIPDGLQHIAVCLACNDEYVKYTSVLLASIYANSSPDTFYDIVILHRDIAEVTRRVCKGVFKNAENFSLRFCDVSLNFEAYSNIYINRHLTYETYYRFFITDIFEGYDKILYLDCDMVANADIAELFKADLTGKYIGASRDVGFIIQANSLRPDPMYVDTMSALKFSKEEMYGYFNAGLILFNIEEIRKDFTTEKMFKVAMSKDWPFHDQDTLNSLFKGKIYYFDFAWNFFWFYIDEYMPLTGSEPAIIYEWITNAFKEPKLIHFVGAVKPWHLEAFNRSNFTVYIFWKYARKSPYYEHLLINKFIGFTPPPTGWLVFTCPPYKNNGIRFFEIHLLDYVWSSSYLYIDLIYLAAHSSTVVDTLKISVSRFPTDDGSSYLALQDYWFEKGLDVFKNSIGIRFEDNQNLAVFVKNPCQYSGFAFSVRFLESRDIEKPRIVVNSKQFVHETIELPGDIKYLMGGGVPKKTGTQRAQNRKSELDEGNPEDAAVAELHDSYTLNMARQD